MSVGAIQDNQNILNNNASNDQSSADLFQNQAKLSSAAGSAEATNANPNARLESTFDLNHMPQTQQEVDNSLKVDDKLEAARTVIDNGLRDKNNTENFKNLLGYVELKDLGGANGLVNNINTDESTKNLLKFYASVKIADDHLSERFLPDHRAITAAQVDSAKNNGIINDQQKNDLLAFM